jgi:Rha family phage regulatory protein
VIYCVWVLQECIPDIILAKLNRFVGTPFALLLVSAGLSGFRFFEGFKMQDLTMMTSMTMTSKEVAELTGKLHTNVLRDVDNLLESLNSELSLGFMSTTYVDSTGKSNRMYLMDRDSTLCLVSGYDANARMRIIKRWQELEAGVVKPPLTAAQHLRMTDVMEAQEAQRIELEETKARQTATEEAVKAIEAKQKAIEMSCRDFAVMAYANLINVKIDLQTASKLGKQCAALSRERNLPIGKVRDPRFGQVNTYIEDVLQEVFTEFADL